MNNNTKVTIHMDFCKLFAVPVELEGELTEESIDWVKVGGLAHQLAPKIVRDYVTQMTDEEIGDYLEVSDGFIEDDNG